MPGPPAFRRTEVNTYMKISAQTKIAALLKHHPDALEAIVTLSPDFKKLRNPVLRKLMAGRTSIAMASKIGGCVPEDFFRILKPLGFEADTGAEAFEEAVPPGPRPELPLFLAELKPENQVILDVREMLAAGTDPLKLIQKKVADLAPGQVLKIVNTFEPTPLIKLLERQGFSALVDRVGKDHVETYFYRLKDKPATAAATSGGESEDWELTLERFKNRLQEVDVRHLEMPQPMMTILTALETLPEEQALFVHHKRVPIYLLDELKDRDFDYRIRNIADAEVNMLIFKR